MKTTTMFGLSLLLMSSLESYASIKATHNLGTKTTYFPHADISKYEKAPRMCKPVFVSMLTRHGSRTMSSREDLELILNTFEESHKDGDLTAKGELVLQWLKDVDKSIPEFGLLTKQGEREQFGIGYRMHALYPGLFKEGKIKMSSTHKKRTQQSRDWFKTGFHSFSKSHNEFEVREGKKCEDLELRYFDNCSLYQDYQDGEIKERKKELTAKILDDKDLHLEIDKMLDLLFKKKVTFKSKRFPKNAQVIVDLYGLCQQDYSLDPPSGEQRFCSLLSTKLRKKMEFIKDDIDSFYKLGPVHNSSLPGTSALNYKMACLPLKSMMNDVESVIRGENTNIANLRFAHLESVLPLAVLVGLFGTKEDLGTEPDPKWKSSEIGGMASNMQWIAYECGEGKEKTHKIKLLYSEKEYHFPIQECQSSYYCDWKHVKKYFEDRFAKLGLGSCSQDEWDRMCHNDSDHGKRMCTGNK